MRAMLSDYAPHSKYLSHSAPTIKNLAVPLRNSAKHDTLSRINPDSNIYVIFRELLVLNNPNRQRGSISRIMVVDDEKDILRIIKRDLESNDANATFKVDAFYDGESALSAFNSHPADYYDLVLTDIRMPKMNGFELYRRLKQRNPSVKIAFITAFEINRDEFSKVLPSIDVKHFIKKPIRMSNLIPRLKSMIEN